METPAYDKQAFEIKYQGENYNFMVQIKNINGEDRIIVSAKKSYLEWVLDIKFEDLLKLPNFKILDEPYDFLHLFSKVFSSPNSNLNSISNNSIIIEVSPSDRKEMTLTLRQVNSLTDKMKDYVLKLQSIERDSDNKIDEIKKYLLQLESTVDDLKKEVNELKTKNLNMKENQKKAKKDFREQGDGKVIINRIKNDADLKLALISVRARYACMNTTIRRDLQELEDKIKNN